MESLFLNTPCIVNPIIGSLKSFSQTKLNLNKQYCHVSPPDLASSFVHFAPASLFKEQNLEFRKSSIGICILNSAENPSKKRKPRQKVSENDESFLSTSASGDRPELISEKSFVEIFGKDDRDLPALGSMADLGKDQTFSPESASDYPQDLEIKKVKEESNEFGKGTKGAKFKGSEETDDLWMQIRGEKIMEEDNAIGDGFDETLQNLEVSKGSDLESEWNKREKKSKDEDEEEDMNRRFKLRNGREVFEERAYLIGVELKTLRRKSFSTDESLEELSQLAETAGLKVVGSTYQRLEHPNPKTYIGAGKVGEIKAAILGYGVETIVFDDELSPGQLRNLEKAFGDKVRVCDRTALILDIFSQRAATKEATLQVELAQTEYQLPRLTRMWSHLERQAGGLVKGMGEKQIEVDKRILRTRIGLLKRSLETVREHRQQYRDRRAATPIPVASLVGYTNAGKSTLLNRLSGAGVLAEDKLFATLDPTTRRVLLPSGKDCLVTDTVGFIQKLPTQLVAAFRATLEEISQASLLLHVVDISHPMVEQQTQAVENVLQELDVGHIPVLSVWNKIDKSANPRALRRLAERRGDTVCISALSGEGMDDFYEAMEDMIKDLLVPIEAVIPYDQMELIHVIHRLGMVESEEYLPEGTYVNAHVPLSLSRQLASYNRQLSTLNFVSKDFISSDLTQIPSFNFSNISGHIEIDV